MANKTTKPYDWNPFVKHGAKVLNEEAGVNSPASAAKEKKPYYVSINGNLTDVNDPEWVKRAADAPRDTIKTPVTAPVKPKTVKSPIGNIKIISDKKESWDQELKIDADTKRHVMKQDYEARKYNKPMSSSAAILREIISDKAKAKLAKAPKSVAIDFSNAKAITELEAYQQSQIEANERARRYHEYIKKTQDPDLHRGLAAVMGSMPEDFNK